MKLVQKHDVLTNEEVFELIYGSKPSKTCPFKSSRCMVENCDECVHSDFWDSDYKGPLDPLDGFC